jgi:transposase InsO family protein
VPQGRGGVKYLFVCLDDFTRFIKRFPLKSATAKACLRRPVEDYIPNVVRPETIISNNGAQFTSKTWVQGLEDAAITTHYSFTDKTPQVEPVGETRVKSREGL